MSDTQSSLMFTPPSLPKGGGAVAGSGGALSAGGPNGTSGYSLSLPTSGGRGVAPALTLDYSSAGGNGPFGLGWQCGLPAVRRDTRFGTPNYDDSDVFIGPGGDTLLPMAQTRSATTLLGMTLPATYSVKRYRSRQDDPTTCLEQWCASEGAHMFWLLYAADGGLTLFGWSDSARLSAPGEPERVAEWLAEESVSAQGEHVLYRWQAEDDGNAGASETGAHPAVSNRYLVEACWGNITPATHLLVTAPTPTPASAWLFCTVLDYGEREASLDVPPTWATTGTWSFRADPFSHFRYGFEVRTRRLCHQALLFHRTGLLAGTDDATPTLVSRMQVAYEQSAVLTVLTACQQVAYEPDGQVLTLPPLEFEMTRPGATPPRDWMALPALDGFAPAFWQLVDLYGEGLPGLLYQDQGAWWYRAPCRAATGSDAVTWEAPRALPAAPAAAGMLTDLNGDGRLDWLVTAPGQRGYFTLTAQGQWQDFIALEALPAEFHHDAAQLVDLTGGGLQDLVMIGPRSVRLWPNSAEKGWASSQDVAQSAGIRLPAGSGDAQRLVAFSDLLGAGQQQLVEITPAGVTCWPNLGHGRFAAPVVLDGFSMPAAEFAAQRVFLADIDGNGCTDILYLNSRGIQVLVNQGGNGFKPGAVIPTPEGVMLDDTCTLQVADVQGLGVASLLLTVPHPRPRTWCCNLSTEKPWLLSEVCNNMGARTHLTYRSSAQCWLDEKAYLQAAGQQPVCYLPFPVHTLNKVRQVDEITGTVLSSETRYLRGIWDGRQREFRGFGLLLQLDTESAAQGSAAETSPPAMSKTWYLSGIAERDASLAQEFWSGTADYPMGEPRFTRFEAGRDVTFTPSATALYWMQRALKGQPLRTETYGLDNTEAQCIPYVVTQYRYQVRATETAVSDEPAVLVMPVETLDFSCERIASDPMVTQSVVLEVDAFGCPGKTLSITYPRKGTPQTADYPASLPEGLLAASQDEQQDVAWLNLQRSSWHHLQDLPRGEWVIGLPDGQRSDALSLAANAIPAGGMNIEWLTAADSPLGDLTPFTFLGQGKVYWCAGDPQVPLAAPTRQALVAFNETAVFDEQALAAYSPQLSPQELQQYLETGGYIKVPALFEGGYQGALWASQSNFTWYEVDAFCQPYETRASALTGKTQVTRDAHRCVVIRVTDAAGLGTEVQYDWRFLAPFHVTDVNDNHHVVRLDALGRVRESRFYGTENGAPAGYSADKPFTPPTTVEEALALKDIPVAACHVTVADSWMPLDARTSGQARCGALALRRSWQREHPDTPLPIAEGERQPPHVISLQTDRYDGDAQQQVRVQVGLSDGFGRLLQAAVLSEPGEALVRTPEGRLNTDARGIAATAPATVRWAVSGRTQYNNKGQPVRSWQPFYLDDWRWVTDDTTRPGLYADTHLYDALGREYRVITAAGWERRTQVYPWFTVAEDENDTAQQVLDAREDQGSVRNFAMEEGTTIH